MIEYAHDLSDHRFNKGKDALRQAELLLINKEYDGSVNHSYYAIRSLLVSLVDIDSRKHTGVISCFDKYFVKTGLFEKSFECG